MSHFLVVCLAALALVASGQRASAASIILVQAGGESTELKTRASSVSAPSDLNLTEPPSIPFEQTDSAQSAEVVARTRYSLTSTALDVTVEQHSWQSGRARSDGFILFSVDQDVAYSISGEYQQTNSGASASSMALETSLDVLNGSTLFDNLQRSSVAGGSSQLFRLGNTDGDENRLSGSLTGVLTAGTLYRLSYDAEVGELLEGAGPGTATGRITLSLVPEPSSGLLTVLGLAAMAARRRAGSTAAPTA